jgi:hypothetical protein
MANTLLMQVTKMATKILSGKKYFYAKGQSARDRGLTKSEAEDLYVKGANSYARIYFDKGYRKLSM